MKTTLISARTQLTISFLVLVLFSAVRDSRAEGRCGAGVDLVVQALEKVKADSKPAQLEDANQLLKRATELCAELGDAADQTDVQDPVHAYPLVNDLVSSAGLRIAGPAYLFRCVVHSGIRCA